MKITYTIPLTCNNTLLYGMCYDLALGFSVGISFRLIVFTKWANMCIRLHARVPEHLFSMVFLWPVQVTWKKNASSQQIVTC